MCSCAYDYITVEADTDIYSQQCVHKIHKSCFQKDTLKMQQCDRNNEMPVLYKK